MVAGSDLSFTTTSSSLLVTSSWIVCPLGLPKVPARRSSEAGVGVDNSTLPPSVDTLWQDVIQVQVDWVFAPVSLSLSLVFCPECVNFIAHFAHFHESSEASLPASVTDASFVFLSVARLLLVLFLFDVITQNRVRERKTHNNHLLCLSFVALLAATSKQLSQFVKRR